MSVKALTLHQPWASLIAHGVKSIETRDWSTKYRGPLVIHASKNQSALCYFAWLEEHHGVPEMLLEPFSGLLTPIETNSGLVKAVQGLPLGAIVATCELVDVLPITRRNVQLGEPDPGDGPYVVPYGDGVLGLVRPPVEQADFSITDQRPYGDFTPGRYAWLLDDIKPVDPPVPCRGYQGLWTPPDDVLVQLEGAAA